MRFMPCRIRHGRPVNAAEMVRRQCPARTPLAGFFNSLLTGLSVEQTRLVSRDVEVGIFLVDLFVAVDPVLLRIVPHGVVPPIEQRLGLGLVDRITIGTAGMLLNQPGRDIVDFAVSGEGIQHDKETGLMVIQFIDAGIEIRLGGKRIRAPSGRRKTPEQSCTNKKNESTQVHDLHVLRRDSDEVRSWIFLTISKQHL